MSKRVHKTAEELQAAWKARMQRIQAQLPRNFKQWCAQCQQTSVMHMNRLVYMQNSPNRRSGQMKRNEKLVYEGIYSAALVNRAMTGERYCYPTAVHFGRKAMMAPTRRGRKAFAWLWNRAKQRPGPYDGDTWRELVKKGQAVVTPQVAAAKARPWRDEMVKTMREKLALLSSSTIMRIVRGN